VLVTLHDYMVRSVYAVTNGSEQLLGRLVRRDDHAHLIQTPLVMTNVFLLQWNTETPLSRYTTRRRILWRKNSVRQSHWLRWQDLSRPSSQLPPRVGLWVF